MTGAAATPLWTLEKDAHQVACLVRLVEFGIEIDIAQDGVVTVTRAFETEAEAMAWVNRKRAARETDGWRRLESHASTDDRRRIF